MSDLFDYAREQILTAAEEDERHLDLSGLDLAEVPPEIGRLARVTHLSLRGNALKKLPAAIGQLTRLEQLSLADNRLETLPPEIGSLPNLRHLNLKNNGLRQLPQELLQLEGLESLQLAGNLLPLPAEIVAKWNRPTEILAYYRAHCLPKPEPPPVTLPALVVRYFSSETLARLWSELAVPEELGPAESLEAAATAFVTYHVANGLETELRELLQVFVPHIDWSRAPVELAADEQLP